MRSRCFFEFILCRLFLSGRIVPPETPDVILSVFTALFIFFSVPLVFYCPFSRIVFDKSALAFTRRLLWCFYLPLCFSFVLSHSPFTAKSPQRVDATHFTSRSYGTMGQLLRVESGVTIQLSDSVELSDQILDRFEDAFHPYWQPRLDGSSHPDSFHHNNLSSTEYNNQEFNRFYVLNTPQTAFARYPQGAVFKKFASKFLHVYPDLVAPLLDPNAVVGHGLSEVPFTSDVSWQIKESFFLSPESPIPYSSRHQPPQLIWKTEKRENGLQRLHLTITGNQRQIISIPVTVWRSCMY